MVLVVHLHVKICYCASCCFCNKTRGSSALSPVGTYQSVVVTDMESSRLGCS